MNTWYNPTSYRENIVWTDHQQTLRASMAQGPPNRLATGRERPVRPYEKNAEPRAEIHVPIHLRWDDWEDDVDHGLFSSWHDDESESEEPPPPHIERVEGEDVALSYSDGSVKEAGTFGPGAWHIKGSTMKYSHREYPGSRALSSGRVELLYTLRCLVSIRMEGWKGMVHHRLDN